MGPRSDGAGGDIIRQESTRQQESRILISSMSVALAHAGSVAQAHVGSERDTRAVAIQADSGGAGHAKLHSLICTVAETRLWKVTLVACGAQEHLTFARKSLLSSAQTSSLSCINTLCGQMLHTATKHLELAVASCSLLKQNKYR
jgi:hypothetical protein